MNKKIVYFIFILLSFCFMENVNAETLFEQNEGKYYIVHKWVKNSSGSGNNYYYVGLFNNKPTISNETISDTENITYYKVSTDYTDLIRFLNTGSSAYYETKTTTNNSMKLNTDSSYMLFSNFDLIDNNGNTYFAKNEYEYQVAVETVTIDYVTIDDLNTQINYVSQINNFNTNNTYNTNLVNFITSGDYLEYGQYYYIAGSSTYNGNVLYISDDPNFLKISGNAYLIKASQEYPVYKYNSYSNTKEYIYEDIVSTTRTPVYLYYKNMDGKFLMATNVNEIYLTEDTAFYFSTDDVRFEPSSLFYVNDGTKLHLSTHYSLKPSINITRSNETKVTIEDKEYITDVTLNVKFSLINNEKYIYQYKFIGTNEGLWTTKTMEEDNFSMTFNENGSLIVRIIDKETNEDITSKTFTIASIEKTPDSYVIEDTLNSSSTVRDVVFHECNIVYATGYALCKITLNNIDTNLYKYYYKIGDGLYTLFYPDEKTQVLPEVYDDSLLIKTNDEISLYKKWQNSNDDISSYLLSLKIFHNTDIVIMRETKADGFKKYYTITITKLTDQSEMGKIEQFLYNHLLSKFYFVNQFKQIIEYINEYNFEENAKAPQFTFNLNFIGLEPVTVDMEIDEHSRLLIQGYIKLFASIAVVYTFIKETAKLFKN